LRKDEHNTVAGIRAPGPKATPWAALIVALCLCLLFLAGIGLWRLAALLIG
jgi:hypothetical protein